MRTGYCEKEYMHGVQRLYSFPNNYGASVVRHDFSYGNEKGLWELAVFFNGYICYDTDITDDVLGHLTEEEVDHILDRIENLPAKEVK